MERSSPHRAAFRIDANDAYIEHSSTDQRIEMTTQTETAILAGGCFWGMEALLRHLAYRFTFAVIVQVFLR
jgi:hypothetical protein